MLGRPVEGTIQSTGGVGWVGGWWGSALRERCGEIGTGALDTNRVLVKSHCGVGALSLQLPRSSGADAAEVQSVGRRPGEGGWVLMRWRQRTRGRVQWSEGDAWGQANKG